jgi:Uma2 family endonuclease
MIELQSLGPGDLRPLRRSEYDRLVEAGCFEDERIELLAGMLVAKEPQSAYHADLIRRMAEELILRIRDRGQLRVQSPLAIGDDSEPEPDLAIVPDSDYRRTHPSEALLVVEIAGSSSHRDRTLKAAIYARGEVQEYWVVDLAGRFTDVFRARESERWTSVVRVPWTDLLSPVAFPDLALRIADLA